MVANTFGPHKPSRRWTRHSPGGDHHSQIDYIMVKQRFKSSVNIAKTRSFPGADSGSGHELVMTTFRHHLQRIKNQGNIRISINFLSNDRRKVCSTPRPWKSGNRNRRLDQQINTAVTETANNILGKHRPAMKPWVTDNILKLCDKRRELKQKKNTTEGAKLYREANQQAKNRHEESKGDMDWRTMPRCRRRPAEKQQQESLPACERTDRLETMENYYHPNPGNVSEEQDILKRWTEYCSELFTHNNNRRSQGARCPSTKQQWQLPYPGGRSWSRSKITEERQVDSSGQHSIGAAPRRRRGHDRYVTHHPQ